MEYIVLELIELKKVPCNMIFKEEIKLLEFIEMIGDMNIDICINSNERDKKLIEIGKKNSKEHPVQKKMKNNKKRYRCLFHESINFETKVLSQEEIDQLLTPINNDKTEVLSQGEIDQLLSAIN
jgi:hypothetical protein